MHPRLSVHRLPLLPACCPARGPPRSPASLSRSLPRYGAKSLLVRASFMNSSLTATASRGSPARRPCEALHALRSRPNKSVSSDSRGRRMPTGGEARLGWGNHLGRRQGASKLSALQDDLKPGRHRRMVYYAFNLLHLDGFDIRDAPLIERKRVLQSFFAEAARPLQRALRGWHEPLLAGQRNGP